MNGCGVTEDKKKATELYQRASDMDNSDAMNNLGTCYMKGCGVIEDKKKAVELYQSASGMGDAAAMNNLGRC